MDTVNLVDFIFLSCSLKGIFGIRGAYMYLVGVSFGEYWESVFTWCWFSLLSGAGL